MIPHVGEQILEEIDSEGLIQCLLVSETWKVLVEKVLFTRWKCKLYEACETGKVEIVKILLERLKSEDPELNRLNYRKYRQRTPFMISCEKGHNEVVQLLLDYSCSETIDFNVINNYGETAFHLACQKGHTDVVKLFFAYSDRKNISFEWNRRGSSEASTESV